MSSRVVSGAFASAIAKAKAREDWSCAVRNFAREFDGVDCNVHLRVQVIWQQVSGNPRVNGECLVYVTHRTGAELAGGSGWLHFGMSEAAAAGAERLFEIAFEEARLELARDAVFRASAERRALDEAAAKPRVAAPARRSRL